MFLQVDATVSAAVIYHLWWGFSGIKLNQGSLWVRLLFPCYRPSVQLEANLTHDTEVSAAVSATRDATRPGTSKCFMFTFAYKRLQNHPVSFKSVLEIASACL